MDIKHGARPTELDQRDQSFHRTFGTVSPISYPPDYCVDAGFGFPDQNADGNPFSCTAYTVADLGADQDALSYAPSYTYMKTLFMQDLPPTTQGSDIRPALKSAKVYGLLPQEGVPATCAGQSVGFTAIPSNWPPESDTEAGKMEHRKGDYFNVYDDGGLDWFDGFRSALWINKGDKRGISIGTPWFGDWQTPIAGIMTDKFVYDGNPTHYAWHNWACKGWKTIDGIPYLLVKSWQGPHYGDGGWAYMSRETVNKVMEIRGTVAYTLADARPEDVQSIKLGMLELVLLYLARILGKKRYA